MHISRLKFVHRGANPFCGCKHRSDFTLSMFGFLCHLYKLLAFPVYKLGLQLKLCRMKQRWRAESVFNDLAFMRLFLRATQFEVLLRLSKLISGTHFEISSALHSGIQISCILLINSSLLVMIKSKMILLHAVAMASAANLIWVCPKGMICCW